MKTFFLILLCTLTCLPIVQAQTIVTPTWTTACMGNGILCSKDGAKILTWGDNCASIWNRNENNVYSLAEWRSKYYSAAVSEDCSLFTVVHPGENSTAIISTWDTERRKKIDSFSVKYTDVCSVSFSYNNGKLLVGTRGGWVIARDLGTNSTLFDELIKMKKSVVSVRFIGTSNDFIVVGEQGETKFVNSQNFSTKTTFEPLGGTVLSHIDKNGNYLLLINNDHSGKQPFYALYNTKDASKIQLPEELLMIERTLYAGFSSDGAKIITLYNKKDTNRVGLWDIKSGQLQYRENTVCNFSSRVPSAGLSAQLNSKGNKIVVTGSNRMREIHNIETGKVISIEEEYSYDQFPKFIGETDDFLTFGANDDVMIERSTYDGEVISRRVGITNSYFGSWDVSPDGNYISLGSWKGPVKILNAQNGHFNKMIGSFNEITLSAAFSKDGKTVITNSTDTIVRKWDVETGALKSQFISGYSPKFPPFANTDRTSYLHFDEENNLLSIAYRCETNIHDATNGKLLYKFKGHTGPNETVYMSYTSYVHSTESKKILTGGIDGTLEIRSTKDGSLEGSFKGVQNSPRICIAYEKGEKKFAFADAKCNIYKYDVNYNAVTQVFSLKGTWETTYGIFLDIDSENKNLAVGVDGVISLRNWDNGKEIWRDSFPVKVTSVKFSNSGREIAIGFNDGTIHVLSTVEGKRLFELREGAFSVFETKFLNDDKSLIAISDNKMIKRWDFSQTYVDENPKNRQEQEHCRVTNPTQDALTVFFDVALSETAEYNIFNSMGAKVDSGSFNSGSMSYSISIKELNSGVYVFCSEVNGKKIQERFVVMR